MKRFFAILLSMILVSTLLPLSAMADGAGWYEVNSTSPRGYTYLYSAPSDRDHLSRNLGKYTNGEIVYVLDYYGGKDGKYNYCYVQTQDGKTGYMHDYALTRTTSSNWGETSSGWYEVNSTSPYGYTYLYSAASDRDHLSYNKGRYNNGELVYVMEYYGGQDGKYNYCYVRTEDGKTGYMHDYALTPVSSMSGGYDQLANLPRLSYQCRGTVKGGNAPVYTGPASNYFRTASGNAYVVNGSSVFVYGKEGDYYLVRYNGTQSGKTVTRYSMIHRNRINVSGSPASLSYSWVAISINSGAHISDAPDWNHGLDGITVDRTSAFALAQMTDASGTTWVYFESTGRTSSGYLTMRGFVPMSEVRIR
ncbi:MAG: hypothetical protein IKL25_00980 [Clostridia bacterium]|nr:hypothetical protein [Clostridia bacterium]